jgi:hypothetical protein
VPEGQKILHIRPTEHVADASFARRRLRHDGLEARKRDNRRPSSDVYPTLKLEFV